MLESGEVCGFEVLNRKCETNDGSFKSIVLERRAPSWAHKGRSNTLYLQHNFTYD
jgi:hypothetical protein